MKLTADRLHEVLNYYPRLGIFRWRYTVGPNGAKGRVAGCLDGNGYVGIKIDSVLYKAHRLAWLWMKNIWPIEDVEHKNRKKNDNRWTNLRLANDSLNQANVGRRIDNTAGFKSVHKRKENGKYRVRIQVKKKRYHLGDFDSPQQAHVAYIKAAIYYFGKFAHAG